VSTGLYTLVFIVFFLIVFFLIGHALSGFDR
jgi:hypothetical protein